MIDTPSLMQTIKELRKTAFQVIPLSMVFEKENIRTVYDEQSLLELGQSIKSVGLQSPVILVEVDAGRYEVEQGHRRVRASKLVGLETIVAIVKDAEDALAGVNRVSVQLIENIQREDISDADLEGSIVLLLEGGMTHEEIQKKLNKSYSWVYKYTSAHDKRKTLAEADVDVETVSTNVLSLLPVSPKKARAVIGDLATAGLPLTAAGVRKLKAEKKREDPPMSKTPSFKNEPSALAVVPMNSTEAKIRALLEKTFENKDFQEGFVAALNLVLVKLGFDSKTTNPGEK